MAHLQYYLGDTKQAVRCVKRLREQIPTLEVPIRVGYRHIGGVEFRPLESLDLTLGAESHPAGGIRTARPEDTRFQEEKTPH